LKPSPAKTWEKLAGLREDLPMTGPEPAQPSHWMERARTNNPQLLASRYRGRQRQGRAPDSAPRPSCPASIWWVATRQVGYSNIHVLVGVPVTNQTGYDGKSIGIEASMPLFAGGGLNSQRKEASYRYQAAEEAYRLVWRDVGQGAQSLARQVPPVP
jgi:outer membrane protein